MKQRRSIFAALLFALLFALCVTVSRHIVFSGDVYSKMTKTFFIQGAPLLPDLLVFAAVAAACAALVFAACFLLEKRRNEVAPRRACRPLRFAVISAALIAAAWLPSVLSIAPGCVVDDSMHSVSQMLIAGHPTLNHHPMFYTVWVGVVLRLGYALFGSYNAGVLLYSLLQCALMLLCIVLVLTLMEIRGVPRPLIAVSLLYFMFIPFFPVYAMTMWKDPLFSCMLLLMTLLLCLFPAEGKPGLGYILCLGLTALGSMAMRNNGLYIILALAVLAPLTVGRRALPMSGVLAFCAALFMAATSFFSWYWGAYEDYIEKLGIPLQQLGYAMNDDTEFSEEDLDFLLTLCPEDVWRYGYRPCLVDSLKWNPSFNVYYLQDHKDRFFSVWFHGLLKNPSAYVKAYLLATLGFWEPQYQNIYGYTAVGIIKNRYGIEQMDLFQKLFGFSILEKIETLYIGIGSGTLLWLVLFGCLLTFMRRRSATLPYLPALLNWGTIMVATPVAFSLRYVFIFALGLPLYFFLPLMLGDTERTIV